MTNEIIKKLEKIHQQAKEEIKKIHNGVEWEKFKIKYLGRKGELNEIFQEFNKLSDDVRKEAGKVANQIKNEISGYIDMARETVSVKKDFPVLFDETIPGMRKIFGTLHPITQFTKRLTDVFVSMGFEIVENREVETTAYNFDKLNIPESHPARDMWDTFYVKSNVEANEREQLVLRTHTSPVQLHAMKTRRPPVRFVVPGRVFRHEATDASHETTFYQLEGLVIDHTVSVANMVHVLHEVLKRLFGEEVKIRIRPSFFPFVEPGHEIDMSCTLCEQKGCAVCKHTGWVEMLGAGMVHPFVLQNMKIDPENYTGFAFGMGIDRLMMRYFGVDDIRLSYSGDLRFLKQF